MEPGSRCKYCFQQKAFVSQQYVGDIVTHAEWISLQFSFLLIINVLSIFFFQLVMFILDLQGEPKGLSIGGLAVITKSLSLTVSYRDVVHLLTSFQKARNTAIFYKEAVVMWGQGWCPNEGTWGKHETKNTVIIEYK